MVWNAENQSDPEGIIKLYIPFDTDYSDSVFHLFCL